MFRNLSAEIKRVGITNKDFAKAIKMNPITFSKKINGKADFSLSEIRNVVEFFNCKFSFDYLFEDVEEFAQV